MHNCRTANNWLRELGQPLRQQILQSVGAARNGRRFVWTTDPPPPSRQYPGVIREVPRAVEPIKTQAAQRYDEPARPAIASGVPEPVAAPIALMPSADNPNNIGDRVRHAARHTCALLDGSNGDVQVAHLSPSMRNDECCDMGSSCYSSCSTVYFEPRGTIRHIDVATVFRHGGATGPHTRHPLFSTCL